MTRPLVPGSAAASEPSPLAVVFCGERRILRAPETLTFGRSADLTIDDDPRLHRVAGRLAPSGDHWNIENLGRSMILYVVPEQQARRLEVAPGGVQAVRWPVCRVRFTVGRSRFELELETTSPATDPSAFGVAGDPDRTESWESLDELNEEQRELLFALVRPRLEHPDSFVVPSVGEIADALGWTKTKVNRKFDYLYRRLVAGGNVRLRSVTGADRRAALIDFVLSTGLSVECQKVASDRGLDLRGRRR